MIGPITIIEKFSTKIDFFIPNAYAPVFTGPRIELDNKTILLNAEFIPTNKNNPAENFLSDCGFIKNGDIWTYEINNSFNIPEFIKIETE